MKKRILANLRRIANMLPHETVGENVKTSTPKSIRVVKGSTFTDAQKKAYNLAAEEYNKDKAKDDHKPTEINPSAYYDVGFPVNHYRRLKRAYQRDGKAGVDAYLRKYGLQFVPAKATASA